MGAYSKTCFLFMETANASMMFTKVAYMFLVSLALKAISKFFGSRTLPTNIS